MKQARAIIIVTLAVAATVGITAALTVHESPDWTHSAAEFQALMSVTSAMAIVFVGATVLFITSLGSYKAELRVCYITIAIGLVLTAISTLQFPILDATGLSNSTWARSGVTILPYIVSAGCAYFGVRRLAWLIGSKTIFSSRLLSLATIIVGAIASVFLPHAPTNLPETTFNIAVGIVVAMGIANGIVAYMVLRVKQHIGGHYVNAMAWLYIAYAGAVGVLVAALIHMLSGGTDQDLANTIVEVLSGFDGLLFLQAAYAFSRTEEI